MEAAYKNTPVCTHAAHFANADGTLTMDSIMKGQEVWGITGKMAKIRAKAVLNMCGDDKTVEGLSKLENPARTGIWNTDGTFNAERFKELKAHAVSEDGIEMVTLSVFQSFLTEKNGCGFSGFATTSYGIPITWSQVTTGSLADYCNIFSDCTYEGKKAVSVDKLLKFYTQTKAEGTEAEAKDNKIEI